VAHLTKPITIDPGCVPWTVTVAGGSQLLHNPMHKIPYLGISKMAVRPNEVTEDSISIERFGPSSILLERLFKAVVKKEWIPK
jgi:hypothetical protein